MASRFELDVALNEMELAQGQTGVLDPSISGSNLGHHGNSEHAFRQDVGSLLCSRRLRVAWATSIVLAAVGAVGLSAATWRRRALPSASLGETVTLAGAACHTAVKGEACFDDVRWAMTTGITQHPEWYSIPCESLTTDSLFEEFQACVFKINAKNCPLPCNPDPTKVSDSEASDSEETSGINLWHWMIVALIVLQVVVLSGIGLFVYRTIRAKGEQDKPTGRSPPSSPQRPLVFGPANPDHQQGYGQTARSMAINGRAQSAPHRLGPNGMVLMGGRS